MQLSSCKISFQINGVDACNTGMVIYQCKVNTYHTGGAYSNTTSNSPIVYPKLQGSVVMYSTLVGGTAAHIFACSVELI